jgi:hypothetical protein
MTALKKSRKVMTCPGMNKPIHHPNVPAKKEGTGNAKVDL